jgi:hypothetical protein
MGQLIRFRSDTLAYDFTLVYSNFKGDILSKHDNYFPSFYQISKDSQGNSISILSDSLKYRMPSKFEPDTNY